MVEAKMDAKRLEIRRCIARYAVPVEITLGIEP